eukprot:scaffold35976_cov19-Tisochrysis_lutea.AAC.1
MDGVLLKPIKVVQNNMWLNACMPACTTISSSQVHVPLCGASNEQTQPNMSLSNPLGAVLVPPSSLQMDPKFLRNQSRAANFLPLSWANVADRKCKVRKTKRRSKGA